MSRVYDLENRLILFAVLIIDIVELLPNNRAANHIAGQLVRSGTSPAPNYSESQSAESTKDFIHKIKISLKELRETRVWLKIILKKKYVTPESVALNALNECEELIKIFSASAKTAKENQ